MLLTGLTRYVVAQRYDYVMGCASIDVTQGLASAATLCQRLVAAHLAPEVWRVVPHTPFRPADVPPCTADLPPEMPPLIKAYLRFGASVCGAPAWDEAFQTADVLMLLPMATMNARFRARLLRDAPGSTPGSIHGRRGSRWAA
jgi:putative hemolysin